MTENEKVALIETEQRSKSNTKRIDKLEEQNTVIHQIATSIEVMTVEMKNMVAQMVEVKCGFSDMENKIDTDISGVKQDVNNIGSKVNEVENRIDQKFETIKVEISEVKNIDSNQKAKKWDEVWSKLQWVVIGGLATYMVTQFIGAVFVK